MTALIALCHAPGQGAHAQAGPKVNTRSKAASRRTRPLPSEENEKARELMEEGLRLSEQKKRAEALEAFGRALALSPRYGDAYIAMGDTYMDMGKYEEGFKAYGQAASVEPSNPYAHYSLGAAYNDMAQYGDAFKHFVQAIRLDPNFAEAHYGIGYAYLKLENFKDALVYLRRAVQLQPDYSEAHLALGQTYLGLRNVKSAEGELKILAGLDASAAGDLEKEIREASGVAKLPDRTGLDERSGGASPSVEKSVTPGVTQEQVAAKPSPPAAQNQVAVPTQPPVATRRPAVPGGEQGLTIELSFWESIKNSGDPEEFAAYLNKYPEGQFAELARIRMRALARKKTEASGENAEPKQQASADGASPDNLPKPAAQMPARDGAEQRPKERPSEERPAEEQPAKEPPTAATSESNGAGEVVTVEAALDSLRKSLPSRFSYKVRATGDAVASEVNIDYESLTFEGCTVKWRDQNDALQVALPELDPEAVRVEPLSRPGATFSIQVWDVSISAVGGKGAINEVKNDGSHTVNRYNGLDLQYDDREKAERLAGALRQAIRLCGGKP